MKDVIPKNIEKIKKKVDEIKSKSTKLWKDALEALKREEYNNAILWGYGSISKLVEAIILIDSLLSKLEEEINKDDLNIRLENRLEKEILKMEKQLNQLKIVVPEELEIAHWRRVRNKIAHEGFKADKEQAEKAHLFYEELKKALLKLLEYLEKELEKQKTS